MKKVAITLEVRPETERILARLTKLAREQKGGVVTLGETGATVLEVGLRAIAEEAREKDDEGARAIKNALLGL
jgi:hypothetical protein